MTETEKELTLPKATAKIQQAWRRGKKEVEINGHVYVLRSYSKKATFQIGGETKSQKETWIVAKRKDGALVPTYNVEATAQGNLRSKTAPTS